MESAQRLGVTPLVAQLLHNRDITDADEAASFLNPQFKDLYPPDVIPNINEAADRIVDAARNGERIVIYGDYDVDGVTGIAILWNCLRLMDATVDFYVPHRVEEGYGLNDQAIRKIAEDGAKVIVSVDCGISALAEADLARSLGVDLIITDHHRIGEQLPDAFQIVHPRLGDISAPNPDISGAGVAFKLAWALARRYLGADRVSPEFRDALVEATNFAALGTIADVVPLRGENRILARFGLAGLAQSRHVGISALLESAGLKNSKLDSYDVGFKLAPRLNAAGRMGHAQLAAELFTRADADRAREIASYLETQNRQRQSMERKITEQAKEMTEQAAMDNGDQRAIVLAREEWHPGVIGIVASRLVDAYSRPAIMIALNGQGGQGSGRSIDGFNLYEALHTCRDHLTSYGGHDMAAGLKISLENVEPFVDAFIAHANETVHSAQLTPRLRIDAVVDLMQIDEMVVKQIEALAPFGFGNPRPRLCVEWSEISGEPRRVGGQGQHLQFALRRGRQVIKAIAFGRGRLADQLAAARKCEVAFEPRFNDFNGRRSVELFISDIRIPSD
jgi:single-stranded-DNA-specific exonuclease